MPTLAQEFVKSKVIEMLRENEMLINQIAEMKLKNAELRKQISKIEKEIEIMKNTENNKL